jgi:hypothetical protein
MTHDLIPAYDRRRALNGCRHEPWCNPLFHANYADDSSSVVGCLIRAERAQWNVFPTSRKLNPWFRTRLLASLKAYFRLSVNLLWNGPWVKNGLLGYMDTCVNAGTLELSVDDRLRNRKGCR